MNRNEVEAIEKAIVGGIKKALDKVLIRPFPPPQPGQQPDYGSIIFHAQSEIKNAVHSELSKIRTQ